MRPPVDGEQESRPPLDGGKKSSCKGSQTPKLRRALFLLEGVPAGTFADSQDAVTGVLRYPFRRCRSFPHRAHGRFVVDESVATPLSLAAGAKRRCDDLRRGVL